MPCSAHEARVEVHLLLERRVGQQRGHRDSPAALGGERVRAVGGATQIHAVLPVDERDDVRIGDVEVRPFVREALVLQRLEQQVDRLLVLRPRVLVKRLTGRERNPPVTAANAPLITAAGENVGRVDHTRKDHRVVVRQRMQHRAEADVARALRGRGEQRGRVRRDRELREEVVLDHRVGVVSEPVGIHNLLEDLGVELLGRLARMQLEFGIETEPHRPSFLEASWRSAASPGLRPSSEENQMSNGFARPRASRAAITSSLASSAASTTSARARFPSRAAPPGRSRS